MTVRPGLVPCRARTPATTLLPGMAALCLLAGAVHASEEAPSRTVAELRADLDSGKVTSVELVQSLTRRIEAIDRNGPQLRSIIAINPKALDQARALDKELRSRGPRSPMHGIPVLVKDNIETADPTPTTAGSLALINNVTRRDAPIVANLRAAGAIILGKTNLSEWANFRSSDSTSGWSAVGGLTKNPHVLDRSPCGSSSGSGASVAAGLAPVSIGTETDGSIVCPSAVNGVVGLKPTLGLLSAKHIIPIAHSQDTAGPMATTVMDAALLLAALVGDEPVCDPPSAGCAKSDYTKGLVPTALNGRRIGVLRLGAGSRSYIEPVYARALSHLEEAGATLVEVKMPNLDKMYEAEALVLRVEFKNDLNAYLASSPAKLPARTLAQLIEFNKRTPAELMLFGQDIFEESAAAVPLSDKKYVTARADAKRLATIEGIQAMLSEHKVDLLVAPTTGPAWRVDTLNHSGDYFSFSTMPAVAGYPHLTVPMGQVKGLPLGLSFIGGPWSEDMLLAAGYVFEQRAQARVTPKYLPSIEAQEPAFAPASATSP